MAGEGFAQRRPGGGQLLGGGVDAAQAFGELEGAFGFGAVGEEAAGLPARWWRSCPPLLRSPLGYGRVLWEVDVEQYAAAARLRLRLGLRLGLGLGLAA
jgi:hypothetical protein